MTAFAIYDSTGAVLRTGNVPEHALELQAQEGESLYVGDVGPYDRIDMETGEPVAGAPPALPTTVPIPEYVQERAAAYPSVEQQLDWLWHAMDDGTLPKAEPFYGQIAAVKSNFPKTIDTSDGSEQTIEL